MELTFMDSALAAYAAYATYATAATAVTAVHLRRVALPPPWHEDGLPPQVGPLPRSPSDVRVGRPLEHSHLGEPHLRT